MLWIIIYVIWMPVCYGQQIVTPFSNTAGKKGQTVTMMTTIQKSSSYDYVGMYWFPSDPAYITGIELFNEYTNMPAPDILNAANIFEITTSPSNNMVVNYTLTIKIPNSDAEAVLVASTFEAKVILMATVSTKANLVILDSAQCLEPTGNPEVLEGATVNMLCNVTYFGYREPRVVWEDYNGQSAGSVQTTEPNNHVTSARREKTAAPTDDNKEFYCKVKYEPSALDQGRGTPLYQDMCAIRFGVIYGVTEVKLTPDPNTFQNSTVTIEQGQSMFCNASGSGTITYLWRCDNNQILVDGPELLIDDRFVRGGVQVDCECEASNIIQGQTKMARRPFVLVAYPNENRSTTMNVTTTSDVIVTGDTGNNVEVIIGLVVFISVLVLVTMLVLSLVWRYL